MKTSNPVAIIGAGPVGLAAAAHLLQRGEEPLILEAGDEVGYAIKQWQHVRLFSPWEFNVDRAAVELLRKNGWASPEPDQLPTGREFRERYLLPLASLPELRTRIRLNSRVTAVGRMNRDKLKDDRREHFPYLLTITRPDGREEQIQAGAVLDTSGTWFQPNPVGSGGIPAPGEQANRKFIDYGIPDVRNTRRTDYAGKTTAVVGSGHSAMQVVLDLLKLQEEEPDTRIAWIMRGTNLARVFGGGENDQLEARGELGERARKALDTEVVSLHSPFLIQRIERSEAGSGLSVLGDSNGGGERIAVDRIVGTTGFRPDLDMIREVRTAIDPTVEAVADLAPLIDPNKHSCGSVPPHGINELKHPDENFFIAGIKSYGRAPNFLLATGYEQVRSITAYLAGDYEAADRIELKLPETGVCTTDFILDAESDAKTCCGGPAAEDSDACCAEDEKAKADGESGCGCGTATETATVQTGCC